MRAMRVLQGRSKVLRIKAGLISGMMELIEQGLKFKTRLSSARWIYMINRKQMKLFGSTMRKWLSKILTRVNRLGTSTLWREHPWGKILRKSSETIPWMSWDKLKSSKMLIWTLHVMAFILLMLGRNICSWEQIIKQVSRWKKLKKWIKKRELNKLEKKI